MSDFQIKHKPLTPDQILKEIDNLHKILTEIQDECSHPEPCVNKIPKSFTGNWDRNHDEYWYDCECTLCGKKWKEDQ